MGFRDLFGGLVDRGLKAAIGRGYPSVDPGGTPAYRAASGLSQELAGYWPAFTSADSAVLPNIRISLDRTRDLIRNDPHAAAAVARLTDMLVGSGWTLVATPDARALGLAPEVARELGRKIRSEWKLYTRDPRKFCDARRRLTMNGIFRLAARTTASAGEATAALKFDIKRVVKMGARYSTCVALVDPDRVCNPNNQPDSLQIRGGVEFDADGVAVAYHMRNAHVGDWWAAVQAQTWVRIPREMSWGRPVFIHAFEGDREDQTRAITPFAALLSRLRMIGKFADTELASATANALFAAFVESDLPADEIANRMSAPKVAGVGEIRASYLDRIVDHYQKHPAMLGGVRIPVMLPGSKISMNNAPRQTASFASFQTAFLQSIAAHLGLSYEQLAMDWSRTNYSSARAALNEVWRTIKRMQAVFAEQFVQPIYMAFLEEAFDKGYIVAPAGCPDFWDMPEAWLAARWIGPGRGYIDPTKEAEASALRQESLTTNLEIENAEQGIDWEENIEQIAFENEVLAANKLSRMSIVAAVKSDKGAKPDSEEATGPSGPGGDQQNGNGA